jgi:hypothetical protein
MNTAAGTVKVGQHIATIPSVATGTISSTAGTVTEIETFEIQGHTFVEFRLGRHGVIVPANTLVTVS